MRLPLVAAAIAAAVSTAVPTLAGGEWPDGPHKDFFQNLMRPDNYLRPSGRDQSLFCCGVADVVKTKFKVETGTDNRYPEDQWFAWLATSGCRSPPEKIVQDFSPDGQPYLFMWSDSIQCFVRPKGGL